MRFATTVVLSFAVSLFAGCRLFPNLTEEEWSRIDGVQFEFGPASGGRIDRAGIPLPPLQIAIPVGRTPAKSFSQFTDENHIDIGGIARRAFERRARWHYELGKRLRPQAAVKLCIRVTDHGLRNDPPFTSYYGPTLSCSARLIDAAGEEIWSGWGGTIAGDPLPTNPLETWYANPSLLAAAFTEAAEIAADRIFRHL